MITFHPHTLYPLDELGELLAGVVELPTFLDRLGLRDNRVFKHAVWGWEIIDASQRASKYSDVDAGVLNAVMQKPVTGRVSARGSAKPVQKLSASVLNK